MHFFAGVRLEILRDFIRFFCDFRRTFIFVVVGYRDIVVTPFVIRRNDFGRSEKSVRFR